MEQHLDIELTDEQLDEVSGGGKYDTHGQGSNNGKACNNHTTNPNC